MIVSTTTAGTSLGMSGPAIIAGAKMGEYKVSFACQVQGRREEKKKRRERENYKVRKEDLRFGKRRSKKHRTGAK